MDVNRGAKIAKLMWNKSNILVENVDIDELIWYISKYGKEENILEDNLQDYLYVRKKKKIKGKKIARKFKGLKAVLGNVTQARPNKLKVDEKNNWDKPQKLPSSEVVKKMVGTALEILILTVMGNHIYQFDGKTFLQLSGGATGLDLTGELADIIMLWWDGEFLAKLNGLAIHVDLYKRFKDDINLILDDILAGASYSTVQNEILYENFTFGQTYEKYSGKSLQEIYQLRQKENNEENTLSILKKVAESIKPRFNFNLIFHFHHGNANLPILIVKVCLN